MLDLPNFTSNSIHSDSNGNYIQAWRGGTKGGRNSGYKRALAYVTHWLFTHRGAGDASAWDGIVVNEKAAGLSSRCALVAG